MSDTTYYHVPGLMEAFWSLDDTKAKSLDSDTDQGDLSVQEFTDWFLSRAHRLTREEAMERTCPTCGDNRFSQAGNIEQLLGQLVGASSMCWEKVEDAGEFDSNTALVIVQEAKKRLMQIIGERMSEVTKILEEM